jgi:hypothetical protein
MSARGCCFTSAGRGTRGARSLGRLATGLAVATCLLAPSLLAQRGGGRGFGRAFDDPNEYYAHPDFHGNMPYDGRFVFARIKYRGYSHFSREGPGWAHDYPYGEMHLMQIMREVTALRPFVQSGEIVGGNILALDDPELFKFPVAYLSEPGGWVPTDAEALGLRNYLLKGGFLILDDFGGQADWFNTVQQMRRVLPEARIVELEPSHPIFDSFFKIDMNIIAQTYRGRPVYYGIYENNDPKKRLIAVFNYNNDIGDYWQWSGQGFNPIALTNEAYKLGVNYLVYALTH